MRSRLLCCLLASAIVVAPGCCRTPWGGRIPRIALPHVPDEHAPNPADPGYQTMRRYLPAPTRPVLAPSGSALLPGDLALDAPRLDAAEPVEPPRFSPAEPGAAL